MREYVIMTDSCCDLTDHMAKELELTVVPLTVHIDGHDAPNLLDGSAISFEDFSENRKGHPEHQLFLRPLHHLPVLRHCRGGVEG